MENKAQSPRKSIADRSLRGFVINIQKNAYPRGNQMRYCFTSLEKLKNEAVRVLALPTKVEKVFDETGKPVTSDDQIKEKGLYYISCGEKFASGMPSPRSKTREVVPVVEEEEEEEQAPAQTSFEAALAENIAKKQQEEAVAPSPKKADVRKEKEIASFNRLIVLSNKSVQEAYVESTLSAFASTEPDQKAKLTKFDQLSTLSKNTSYYDFVNHLITNQMAPNYGVSQIQDEVDAWAIDSLKSLSLDDIKFYVSGIPSTGKSSTLYSLSTILFRKVQQSSANGAVLFFPLNFEKLTLEFTSIKQIYDIFITNTLTAARYCNYAVAPFVSSICQWFISIPTSTVMPSFPAVPDHVHTIDFAAMRALGQSIFDVCKVKNNLPKFISTIVDFPVNFAKTIGLHSVIFILDHFEYCNVDVIAEQMFPDSVFAAPFAPEMCRAIAEQKYIVSCEDEQAFTAAFTCEGATPIDTEGICESHVDGRSVIIQPMKVKLSLKDCFGAPAVIASFERVCDLAEKANIDPQQPKGVKTISAVARSRKYILKREVMKLFKILYSANSPEITLDMLNDIEDRDITVTVEGEKQPKEEESQEQTENDDADVVSSPTYKSTPRPAPKKTGVSPSKGSKIPSPKKSKVTPTKQPKDVITLEDDDDDEVIT